MGRPEPNTGGSSVTKELERELDRLKDKSDSRKFADSDPAVESEDDDRSEYGPVPAACCTTAWDTAYKVAAVQV